MRSSCWLVIAVVTACGGPRTQSAAAPVPCGTANIDPLVPRNAPLRTIRLTIPEGTQLRVFNPLTIPVDVLWATREQLYPYPIDRLRLEASNLGRALPGTSTIPVPIDLPEGTMYKLRSEPLAGPGGRFFWTLTPDQWRRVQLRLMCP